MSSSTWDLPPSYCLSHPVTFSLFGSLSRQRHPQFPLILLIPNDNHADSHTSRVPPRPPWSLRLLLFEFWNRKLFLKMKHGELWGCSTFLMIYKCLAQNHNQTTSGCLLLTNSMDALESFFIYPSAVKNTLWSTENWFSSFLQTKLNLEQLWILLPQWAGSGSHQIPHRSGSGVCVY